MLERDEFFCSNCPWAPDRLAETKSDSFESSPRLGILISAFTNLIPANLKCRRVSVSVLVRVWSCVRKSVCASFFVSACWRVSVPAMGVLEKERKKHYSSHLPLSHSLFEHLKKEVNSFWIIHNFRIKGNSSLHSFLDPFKETKNFVFCRRWTFCRLLSERRSKLSFHKIMVPGLLAENKLAAT